MGDLLENGDLEVAGVGRIAFGFTRTERGVFALGSTDPALLGVFTSEEETADYDDDEPMTVAELRDSIRRVLGVDLPLGEPTRLTRFTFHARHVERYRDGRIMLAGDAAHLFPAPGVALNAGMMDSVNLGWKLAAAVDGWAPAGLLDTYHEERHSPASARCSTPGPRWRCGVGTTRPPSRSGSCSRNSSATSSRLRRIGALIAGTDIRYPIPNPNDHALTGTFAHQASTGIAGLTTTARAGAARPGRSLGPT